MWKFIILALACYILYRLFANDIKKKFIKQNSEEELERKVASGEMVKDPVCGVYIDKNSTITVKDGDEVHCFCSYECRDTFLKSLNEGGRILTNKDETNKE